MTDCPHTFKWRHFVFVVEFIQSPLWLDRAGTSRSDVQVIRVDANVSPELQRTTLLHEFLHCVSDLNGLELSEHVVQKLGVFLPSSVPVFSEAMVDETLAFLDRRLKLRLGDSRYCVVEALLGLSTTAPAVVAWIFGLGAKT